MGGCRRPSEPPPTEVSTEARGSLAGFGVPGGMDRLPLTREELDNYRLPEVLKEKYLKLKEKQEERKILEIRANRLQASLQENRKALAALLDRILERSPHIINTNKIKAAAQLRAKIKADDEEIMQIHRENGTTGPCTKTDLDILEDEFIQHLCSSLRLYDVLDTRKSSSPRRREEQEGRRRPEIESRRP